MKITDDKVTGELTGDLITIYVDGVQYYQGLSTRTASELLDSLIQVAETQASYLFHYPGEHRVLHSSHVPPLARILTTLLQR